MKCNYLNKVFTSLFFLSLLITSNQVLGQKSLPLKTPAQYLEDCNDMVTNAIVTDGFSPLLATRSYCYPNIAAYEGLRFQNKKLQTVAGQLKDLTELPMPDRQYAYYFDVVAMTAFWKTCKDVIYREYEADTLYNRQMAFILANNPDLDKEAFDRSKKYGEELAEAIMKWEKTDKYYQTKAQPKYIVNLLPAHWIPTPPEYKSALEPYWHTLRTMVVPNSHTYVVDTFPYQFSKDPNSDFYKMVKEVHDTAGNLNPEQYRIAKFWDCNPDQTTYKGHLMMPRRQMSPTSHWMDLTTQVIRGSGFNRPKKAEVYALVSMALYDGYICCWKQKYTVDMVRPITYIRDLIDSNFMPVLVTPNFPEFNSGHSFVSSAASTVLTRFFGENHSYCDSTELKYNIQPRCFKSFSQAALEAGISRFYGGIHYRVSVMSGIKEGREVAEDILAHVKLEGK